MRTLFFLILFTGLLTSCRTTHKISKAEASTLDTITNINLLKIEGEAVYKAEDGKHYIMRYEPDPRDSTEEIDTLHLNGGGGATSRSFITFFVNKRCDSENFDGSNRKDAKISISPATIETFNTLRSFVNTLPDKELMADSISGSNHPRIASENRNVRIKKAYLYAYSRQTDEDYHVIIGTSKIPTASTKYFNVEVSGLPPATHPSFAVLKATRESFLSKASEKLCASGYYFYNTPLLVEVSGSLFFDKQHHNGLIGPATARPPDAWEIHPATSFIFK